MEGPQLDMPIVGKCVEINTIPRSNIKEEKINKYGEHREVIL
jgi:hypothetical protein